LGDATKARMPCPFAPLVDVAAQIFAGAAGLSIMIIWRKWSHSVTYFFRKRILGQPPALAAIELGGTTCRAAISRGDPKFLNPKAIPDTDRYEIKTTDPDSTLSELVRWLSTKGPFDGLGIASFGPIDVSRHSRKWGTILTTPKTQWIQHDVASHFKQFNVPIGLDTDVNAPALAELVHGQHGNIHSAAYITVGTGVGVGVVVNDSPVHGLLHPEGGHFLVVPHPDDKYPGGCRFHKHCVEGMVGSNALAERKGIDVHQLPSVPDDDPIWDFTAYYLAQLCCAIICLTSTEVIVLSGGVMLRSSLFPKIRVQLKALLNDYLDVPRLKGSLDDVVVSSRFGNDAGLVGALQLASASLSL